MGGSACVGHPEMCPAFCTGGLLLWQAVSTGGVYRSTRADLKLEFVPRGDVLTEPASCAGRIISGSAIALCSAPTCSSCVSARAPHNLRRVPQNSRLGRLRA